LRRSDALERVAPALAGLAGAALVLIGPASRGQAGVGHLLEALLIGGLFATAVGLALAGRAQRRLERLARSAQSLAVGEAIPYLAPERADELGVLEGHFADMARNVASTIAELRLEQERMEAILRGMVEGVVVTDLSMRVVLLNARARELLGIRATGDEIGRPLVELVRDPALQESARELREGAPVVSQDVMLGGRGGRMLS
jgi:signal transduction histidine kinase